MVIVGATGSGKTHAALWHLSNQNFDTKPWIVYDYKNDELINAVEGARHISFDTPLPDAPGLYVIHPLPDQNAEVEDHMFRVWGKENTGVYVDEGFMIGNNNRGFRALLTQGRSKHVPMIILSQRPVWLDRFVFSEASFFQVFRLQHRGDRRLVNEFIPVSIERRLPEFYSFYYDVSANKLSIVSPMPDADTILDTFEIKLRDYKKVV